MKSIGYVSRLRGEYFIFYILSERYGPFNRKGGVVKYSIRHENRNISKTGGGTMRQFKQKWTLDREKFLSEAEVRKLRRVVEDKALADLQKGRTTWPRFWMTIDLAANAGLRVSEIANLKIGNLYLNSREPRIRVTGKGNRTRDVFISRDFMKHLSGFLEWKRTMN